MLGGISHLGSAHWPPLVVGGGNFDSRTNPSINSTLPLRPIPHTLINSSPALYSESTKLYLNALPLFSILTFLLFSNSSVTDQHQHCRYFFPSKTTFFPFASMRCWSNPTLSFNSQRRNTSLIKRHQQREAREGRCPGRLNNERLPLEEASTSPGGKSWILCALYSLYVKYTQCQPIKLCNDHLSVFTAGKIVCLT